MERQRKIKRALFLAGIPVLLAICWLVGRPLIHFVDQPELFRQWVAEQGVWGAVLFVGMVVAQVFLAVIPGGPFEVGAGYAYGVVWGTILCSIGTTLASTLVFLLVRRFGRGFVELFVEGEKIDSFSLLRADEKKESILFLVFLIPGTPKDVISYLVGLSDLKLSHWILICGAGRLPAILLSVVGGAALESRQYHLALWAAGGLVVFYLAGMLFWNWYRKRRRKM